jgi:hypothetical protein
VFTIRRSRRTESRSLDAAAVLYIGLGDQFDDDRRLVRAAAAMSRLTVRRVRRDFSTWLELPVLSDRQPYTRWGRIVP